MLQYHNVSYCKGNKQILKDISFALKPEKITVILGQNGSGKSSIIRLLNQKETAYTGTISLNEATYARSNEISILMQTNQIPEHFTVFDFLKYSLIAQRSLFAKGQADDLKQIKTVLKTCDCLEFIDSRISALSGGERQRVLIAAALIKQPKILILDEPTTYLDVKYQSYILKLITKLNQELKMTILLVIHDINHALKVADQVLIVKGGQIIYDLAVDDVNAQILSETFEIEFKDHGAGSFTTKI